MEGMSLEGRRALVTGAAGGIGSAIARDLDSLGATVIVADVNLEGGRQVAASLRSGTALEVELTDPTSVAKLAQDALAGGPVDVLINCAGWERIVPFAESTPEEWDRQIAINLRAPIQLCHALLPGMSERGWGRIVNISSDAGRVGSSGESVYSACKAGLLGFTKTLARETARKGVTVNAVCPGPTDTPLLQSVKEKSPNLIEALKRGIPVGRLGEPRDVAGAVAFLCTPRAEYITGQTLSVNGGLNMV
ncbi:MAG TPA: SDR family NAD(P)-dependent oxidoreductase [Candidatus Dormibacteraeota bacterium]|nr:SDR family NAD(P)-dependent oxidoreductase [Candidatus Dormibacteraeota bacterium]